MSSTARHRSACLILASCTALVTAALSSRPALAAAPTGQGWWATTSALGPDVPSDGLLTQGGASGPTSYAALAYTLGIGTAADILTLTVAPSSVATPSAVLQLCPLTVHLFTPVQGGAIAAAPAYDCTHKVVASVGAGSNYVFKVSSLASGNALDVAVLPGDGTSRVVLSKPATSSLTTSPSGSTASPPPAPDPDAKAAMQMRSVGGGFGATASPSLATGQLGLLPGIGATLTSSGAPLPEVAPPAVPTAGPEAGTSAPRALATSAQVTGSGTRQWPMGVLVVAALLVAALWSFAGGRPLDLANDSVADPAIV